MNIAITQLNERGCFKLTPTLPLLATPKHLFIEINLLRYIWEAFGRCVGCREYLEASGRDVVA